MDSVLIVAAEASSSLYAQRLMESWKAHGREVDAFGIGSRAMESKGFRPLGRSEEMAVVGLQEVLKHLPHIRNVFYALLSEVERVKPKFALLLDYPDFNLRLAKELKKRGVTVIYYISPQVWAWRTGRVKLIRKVVDHMLVLFPFEKPFYLENQVKVDFVGHPTLDELPEGARADAPGAAERARIQRQRFGIADGDIVLGLMPGSRRSEIAHHLKTQLKAAEILVRRDRRIRAVLMVAPTLEREQIMREAGDLEFSLQIVKDEPLDMIALADVMLVASGTATLMVGLMEKPMVIMYRMNSLTAWLARRLVTKTKFFGMVNLVMGREVVPELFQEDANPERLANEISRLATDADVRARTIEDLQEMKTRLGSKGATERVREILEPYFR